MGKKFSFYNENPADLNEDSLLEYRETLSRYPYCQYARLMFLLNLKQADDEETYRLTLPFVAIALPDRVRLKEQVDSLQLSSPVSEPVPVDPQPEALPRRHAESFSPWSQALPKASRIPEIPGSAISPPPENPGFTPIIEENPARTIDVDTVRTLLNKPHREMTTSPHFPKQAETNHIIDRFLSSGAEHPVALDDEFDYTSFDPDTGNSTREDFSFGSETLAEMYLQKNAPLKAIAVYEHLGLKFPEKSRYFANLIRKVKKDYSIK